MGIHIPRKPKLACGSRKSLDPFDWNYDKDTRILQLHKDEGMRKNN